MVCMHACMCVCACSCMTCMRVCVGAYLGQLHCLRVHCRLKRGHLLRQLGVEQLTAHLCR